VVIPAELVVSGRELSEPRASPIGGQVAFVQRSGGRASIQTVPIDGRGPETTMTFGPEPRPGRGTFGGCFSWFGDGSGLVYAAADGELWTQIGTVLTRLTRLGRVAAAPCAVGSPADARVAFVVDEAEVWMVDTGGSSPRRIDDGRHEFCFDPAIAPDRSTVSWQGWSPPDMPWDGACRVDRGSDGRITEWRPAGGAVQQPRFAPDGTPTCVEDGSGWLNVRVGDVTVAERLEHAGPTWGMGQRSYDVTADGRVVHTRNEVGFGRLVVTEPRTGRSERLGRGVHAQVGVLGDDVIALRSGARTPTQVVRYHRPTGERVSLARGPVAAWDLIALPEPEVVTVDGLVARRYVAGEGRLICWVHGGPTDQWQVEFRPRISFWWSRGWDVLVVDPRGTTGHGRAFQRALNGGWGRFDVDDTATLVAHAHREGWSVPDRTVMMGGSAGGLTALGLLADHPALAAAGVVSYPVSDIGALAQATHRFEAHYDDTLVGRVDDADHARELSPIHRAGRITAALLVFHGTDDPVVPIGQSIALVDRVLAGGGTAELVAYEGEGHGFRDRDNQLDELGRTERFLSTVVGGS
jgi:dipeptidyl aminopeptidase/acylaminoacyl peptidase